MRCVADPLALLLDASRLALHVGRRRRRAGRERRVSVRCSVRRGDPRYSIASHGEPRPTTSPAAT